MNRSRLPARSSRGFSLVEVVVSLGIMTVLLTAVVNTIGASSRTRALQADQLRAHLLAQDLMGEILSQRYEEPFETVVFGPEASETGSDRSAFDDIDDYKNWNLSASPTPPQRKSGVAYAGLGDWVRTVTVEYADPDDLNAAGGANQGTKRITVHVQRDGRMLASVVMVVTESWVPPPYE